MEHTEDLVERSDPLPALRPAVHASLDELGARLFALASSSPDVAAITLRSDIAPAARRQRRRRRVLGGALGIALLAAAAPAAANYIGLHTGHFGDDGGHYGEFLNLDSPDGMNLLREFEARYPLPPGGTWVALEKRWREAPAGEGQAGVFEEAVGGESQCQWNRAWLDAETAHDPEAVARARDVLAQIPHWHVTTAFEDETHGVSKQAEALSAAAARGDRRPIQEYVDANCSDTAPGQ
ncbi:MAG: hypothetical protein QOK28_1621 [Actinomycetota bacterium]|jgi:hypothetical protein